jgi:sugar O-acyltransferase (sialic acid O-acetyltransferase NeuD family)
MPKKPLILVGGGGHCKCCIEVIRTTDEWEIKGILDRAEMVGTKVLDCEVIGTDEEIEKWISEGYYFLVAVGQIRSAVPRKRLYDLLKKHNALIATVVSAKAIVSPFAKIGEGTIIHHQAFLNADTVVGNNCIINTSAVVEHDTTVGDHTHISTGCMLNGTIALGAGCFVGSGTVIANNISITDNVVLGAGTLVIKNIDAPGIYAGVPCKKLQ